MEPPQLLSRQSQTLGSPAAHASSQSLCYSHEVAGPQALAVLPRQSLSMVQIFLNAAIASVLYTRQLLKHDSPVFSDRCVADLLGASGLVSYSDFLHLDTGAESVKSQGFKILLKGRSRRADRILELLEGGIFDALQHGYLETIQLFVCTNTTRPSEVVECYTFNLTYNSCSQDFSGAVSSSVSVLPSSNGVFVTANVQRSFNTAIKGLLKVIHGLPQLPRRRNLGFNLFYTADCPVAYEPQGFAHCVNDELCFPSGPGLVKNTTEKSHFATGAHRLGVVVSHVTPTDNAHQRLALPAVVDYAVKRSRLDEGETLTEKAISSPTSHSSAQVLATLPQQMLASPRPRTPATPSTQIRADIRTKEALQRMQRSSSRPQDLVPTQSLANAERTDDSDSNPRTQSWPKPHLEPLGLEGTKKRKHMIVADKMAELFVHVKAVQEHCAADMPIFSEQALDAYSMKRIRQGQTIKCECGKRTQYGTMLFCEICGTWQHLACYGWEGVSDKLRPGDHICYSCLLLPEEKELNGRMPTLVKCRNTLKYLCRNELLGNDDYRRLAQVTNFQGNAQAFGNSDIMQVLLAQQLVRQSDQGWAVVDENRERAIAEYVDPLASIAHLYEARDGEEADSPAGHQVAMRTLWRKCGCHMLHAIHTHDSFGDDVIRYGYYPQLAAMGSAGKSFGAGEGAEEHSPLVRKTSRSELVSFNDSSSEAQMKMVPEPDDGDP